MAVVVSSKPRVSKHAMAAARIASRVRRLRACWGTRTDLERGREPAGRELTGRERLGPDMAAA
jgi:hypothetical protein